MLARAGVTPHCSHGMSQIANQRLDEEQDACIDHSQTKGQ